MDRKGIIFTNNGFVHASTVHYPYEERGLQFGDGIYEVVRVYQGKCYLLEEHIDRLFRSANAISLVLPFSKTELMKHFTTLLHLNSFTDDGIIYVQITRGSAKRNHIFPKVEPNFYAYIDHYPRPVDFISHGISVITYPDIRWQYCYIKSLNLLPNVLAKQEATEQQCFDAIFHRDEIITESSAANVFIVKDQSLYTHPATEQILHGCVRNRVVTLARNAQINVIETTFTRKDLLDADEVFLTSSGIEVMPVVQIDGKTVGSGTPGAVSKKLQKLYEQDAQLVTLQGGFS